MHMKNIAFIDIGAGYKGAHNTGFIEALYSYAIIDTVNVCLVCHMSISKEWVRKLESKKIQVHKVFKTNIFELFDKKYSFKRLMVYIYELSEEFVSILNSLLEKFPTGDVNAIFHTMSWEHIQALAIAIKEINNNRLRIHVFLMYWPGINSDLKYESVDLAVKYKISLKALIKSSNVKLYTSNIEYQSEFNFLMNGEVEVKLHPYFLGNWHIGNFKRRDEYKEEPEKILLYVGEVKENKGFYQIQRSINMFYGKRKVFFLAVNIKKMKGNKLLYYKRLREKNKNIHFIDKFLSAFQLTDLFNKCDLVILNYNSDEYRNKTSGFLWFAIQNDTILAVPENTWMKRELVRMSLPHFIIDLLQK